MKLTVLGNDYHTAFKKEFRGNPVSGDIVEKSFHLAYEMAYGEGFHRNRRSGGQTARSRKEIFQNTFQGKIAETVLYKKLIENGIETGEPDFSIHGKGIWDDADLKANGKTISIKSAAHFSNLLLLETKDWDSEGRYVPNLNHHDTTNAYDYFVLVRIKPDIKSVLKNQSEEKGHLLNKIQEEVWQYDIAGCCSIKTIRHIISLGYILPQNAMLNGNIRMDASNYYIQSITLFAIEKLFEALK